MTIKDIAKICGVSPSTISKILNNKDEGISEQTRRRVLNVIKEYHYVPYSKAIKNASPASSVIGVLVSDAQREWAPLVYEIERAAAAQGYSIILCNTQGDPALAEKQLAALEGKRADGVIAVCQDSGLLKKTTIPGTAIINGRRPIDDAACVLFDMRDAGYLAASYLLDKGHVKIGCILASGDEDIEQGYLKALRERGIQPNPVYINRQKEPGDPIEIEIAQCLSTNSTAIICSDCDIAGSVYTRLCGRGNLVPGDFSVISARDDRVAPLLNPALTAVRLCPDKLAGRAVFALVEMIEGKKAASAFREKVPLELVERDSVLEPAKNRQGGKIVVVGSMNMDFMIFVDQIPTAGETVLSGNTALVPGGKGANQAVGAGKLDGLVYMIGRLGNDSDGKELYQSLLASGVKMDGVAFDDSMLTGKAYIQVSANGESTIVVYPGANRNLDRTQIGKYKQLLAGAKYCLISTEIPEDAVQYAIKQCAKLGVASIVKPSAVDRLQEDAFGQIDYLVPNKKELAQLVPGDMPVEQKAAILLDKGAKNVIVTLGHKGCYLKNKTIERFFPAADFYPVDTTGGADAFISALAVFLSEGNDIIRSIGFATYAAGICVTRPGVQPAMVDRKGLDIYKDEILSQFR